MNALSEQQRAIVSAIPGTTRDLLEQTIEIDGLPIEITDTAGIRDSSDEIEIEGVRRARYAQQQADLILLVIDDNATTEQQAASLLREVSGGEENNAITVYLVRNKTDASGRKSGECEHGVALSALTGEGMNALTSLIKHHAGFRASEDSTFIARQRHVDALQRAAQCLEDGIAQLDAAQSSEILAEELAACSRILGEITGVVSSDDLLGLIFASFCIGK